MYRKRIIDKILKDKLEYSGAVLIEGLKWCGKTTSAKQEAKSAIYLDDTKLGPDFLKMLDVDPSIILDGKTPRLLDEWQLIPSVWDAVRHEVDYRENGIGQFILTGSSTPIDTDKIHHSGIGRYSYLHMRNMTLYESGESNGEVSLEGLFLKTEPFMCSSYKIDVKKLAYLICRGGWPGIFNVNSDKVLKISSNYYDGLVKYDIKRANKRLGSSVNVENILRSYSRNQGTQTPISVIAKDVNLDDETVRKYVETLRAMFVIEDLSSWNPNLRSKTAIRTAPTRYFSDPSIATASLGIGPDDLLKDLKTLGFLFETLCIRDLRVYAESIDGNVYHYRDKTDTECDAVVHLRNGKYGLIEIKLGGSGLIEEGCKTLKNVEKKIDQEKMGPPSFKMVLTGVGDYAYTREDGIHVVPIGALKN